MGLMAHPLEEGVGRRGSSSANTLQHFARMAWRTLTVGTDLRVAGGRGSGFRRPKRRLGGVGGLARTHAHARTHTHTQSLSL